MGDYPLGVSSGRIAAAAIIARTVILSDAVFCIDAAAVRHAGRIMMTEHRLNALEDERAASDPGGGQGRRAQKAAAPHPGYHPGTGCRGRRIAGLSRESRLVG